MTSRSWLLPLLASCLPISAHANLSALGSGNISTGSLIVTDSTLHPLQEHPTVSIQSEDLHVKLYGDYATVDLTYRMRNEGRSTTVEAGFPSLSASYSMFNPQESQASPSGVLLKGKPRDLQDYKIGLNGKDLSWQLFAMGPVTDERASASQGWPGGCNNIKEWLVSKLPFPGHDDATIHITYRCPYSSFSFAVSEDDSVTDATFAYMLSTGGNWRGPIREGRVEIECVGVLPAHIRIAPDKRFKRAGRSFVWEFTDLKPGIEDDIRVVTDPSHREQEGYIMYGDRWYFNDAPCTAKASSELVEGERRFAARFLRSPSDRRSSEGYLPWAEGVEGDGIGENITLTLKKPCRVDGFYIKNGYSTDKELFAQNNRVSQFEVSVDGQASFRVEVPDTDKQVFIPFTNGSVLAHEVKLTIAGVYRGSRYRDTCVNHLALRQVLAKDPNLKHAR